MRNEGLRALALATVVALSTVVGPIALTGGAAAAGNAGTGVIVVDAAGGSGVETTIQDAIDRASAGETIEIRSGTYDENVVIAVEDVTLLGPNAGVPGVGDRNDEAVVEGQFAIEADGVTIDGFGFVGTETVPEDSNGFTNTIVVDESNEVIGDVTIRNSNLDGNGKVTRAVHLTTIDSGPITIENVTIGGYFLGVNGYGDDVTVRDSSITDIEEGGVNLQQGDDLSVISSTIAVGDAHEGNRYAVRFGYTMTKDGQPRDRNLVIEDSTLAVEIGETETHRHAGVIIRNSSTGDLSVGNSTVAGLISDTETKVTATHNYWGHASGPAGKGADVVGDVDYRPFYLDDALTDLVERSADGDLDEDDPEDNNRTKANVKVDDDTEVSVSVSKSSGASKVSVVESDRSTASTSENVTDSSGNDKNAIYMDISADTDVADEVTITVNKSVSSLENRSIDPNNAVLNHFNETSQEWEELDTSVETRGGRAILTATSKGLSPFAITEKRPRPSTGSGGGRGAGDRRSSVDQSGTFASSTGSAEVSVTSVGRQLSVTVRNAQPGDSVTVQRSDEEVTKEVRRHGPTLESIETTFDQPADFEMTVTSSNNKPDANVSDPPSGRGTVGYVNVQHSTNDDAVREVRFRFRVTTERLEERGIGQDEVVLYRYSDDGEWTALETTFDGVNDDGTLRFTAVSPGLSVFAIGGPQAQQETATEAPTTTEPTTDEPVERGTPTATETEQIEEPSGFDSRTTFLVVIALALIVIAMYALRRRRS